jgi:hypothetical protein
MRYPKRRNRKTIIEVEVLPTVYKCPVCEKVLPIKEFNHGRYKDHFCIYNMCKHCRKIWSSVYLGCDVAEKVLSNVFSNVQRMPRKNHGYDFICSRGLKVDVKASCLSSYSLNNSRLWAFTINRNKIADYFACIAFDDRVNLNPLHFWLIPGEKINRFTSISIYTGETSLERWKKYEKPVDKILTACNLMKVKPIPQVPVYPRKQSTLF